MIRVDFVKSICFCSKNGPKMGAKSRLWRLLENLVIDFSALVYIIYYIHVQIWFLKYGSKCFQPIRFQDFQISCISVERKDETTYYMYVTTNSWMSKVWLGLIKNGHGHSDHRNLKLVVSHGRIDEITLLT